MTSVKKGNLTVAGNWWKHLRWMKRAFWKGERQATRVALGDLSWPDDHDSTDTGVSRRDMRRG